MVCVPCILLPFLLAIYLKFVQPFVLKLVPQAWKTRLDAFLYPTATCPLPNNNKAVVVDDEKKASSILQSMHESEAIPADGGPSEDGKCSQKDKYI